MHRLRQLADRHADQIGRGLHDRGVVHAESACELTLDGERVSARRSRGLHDRRDVERWHGLGDCTYRGWRCRLGRHCTRGQRDCDGATRRQVRELIAGMSVTLIPDQGCSSRSCCVHRRRAAGPMAAFRSRASPARYARRHRETVNTQDRASARGWPDDRRRRRDGQPGAVDGLAQPSEHVRLGFVVRRLVLVAYCQLTNVLLVAAGKLTAEITSVTQSETSASLVAWMSVTLPLTSIVISRSIQPRCVL